MSYGCDKCQQCRWYRGGEWPDGCEKHWPAETPQNCSKFAETEAAERGTNTVEVEVMAAVNAIGDPLLSHIRHRSQRHDRDAVDVAVRNLVMRGDLRMKEDAIDHDWSYSMTRQGKDAFGYTKGASNETPDNTE